MSSPSEIKKELANIHDKLVSLERNIDLAGNLKIMPQQKETIINWIAANERRIESIKQKVNRG